MEEMDFDFVTLTLPNIESRFRKGKRESRSVRIERVVRPFVERLATKHPQWRFVSQHHWNCTDHETKEEYSEAHSFSVYSGKELLGEISTDRGRGGIKAFTMTNERIRKIRERGSDTRTKDLDKAIKIFGKMFGARTMDERLNEVLSDVSSTIQMVHSDRQYEFAKAYGTVSSGLQEYVVKNLDTLADTAVAAGVPQDAIDALPSAHAEYQTTKEILSCLQKKQGDVVLIHGSDYAVTNIDEANKETKLYSTDTLPLHIKRGVGMLKLVEDKHFISGVGVKLTSASFFIIPEATNG